MSVAFIPPRRLHGGIIAHLRIDHEVEEGPAGPLQGEVLRDECRPITVQCLHQRGRLLRSSPSPTLAAYLLPDGRVDEDVVGMGAITQEVGLAAPDDHAFARFGCRTDDTLDERKYLIGVERRQALRHQVAVEHPAQEGLEQKKGRGSLHSSRSLTAARSHAARRAVSRVSSLSNRVQPRWLASFRAMAGAPLPYSRSTVTILIMIRLPRDRSGTAWVVAFEDVRGAEHDRRRRGEHPVGSDVGKRLRMLLHHPIKPSVGLLLRIGESQSSAREATRQRAYLVKFRR